MPTLRPGKAGSLKRPELLANFWQIAFWEEAPERGEVRIGAYLLVMSGLGGLEPPTSPLSGSFLVLYA